MEIGYRVTREALVQGVGLDAAAERAKYAVSFARPVRTTWYVGTVATRRTKPLVYVDKVSQGGRLSDP
jgi:hypothetical protein